MYFQFYSFTKQNIRTSIAYKYTPYSSYEYKILHKYTNNLRKIKTIQLNYKVNQTWSHNINEKILKYIVNQIHYSKLKFLQSW